MVPLKRLNSICAARPVARTIPSQVACRLLGNTEKPCVLDPVCKPVEARGLWVFYGSLALGATGGFCVLFWILRVTRASRLLGLLLRVALPPVQWSVNSAITARRWWDSLFF